MSDNIDLDALDKLAHELVIDGAGKPWTLCRGEYIPLTLDELKLIQKALPRLIELARIGQQVKRGE